MAGCQGFWSTRIHRGILPAHATKKHGMSECAAALAKERQLTRAQHDGGDEGGSVRNKQRNLRDDVAPEMSAQAGELRRVHNHITDSARERRRLGKS